MRGHDSVTSILLLSQTGNLMIPEMGEAQKTLELRLEMQRESCRKASIQAGQAVMWLIFAIVLPSIVDDTYWAIGGVLACALLCGNATHRAVKSVLLLLVGMAPNPSPSR